MLSKIMMGSQTAQIFILIVLVSFLIWLFYIGFRAVYRMGKNKRGRRGK